MRLIKSFGRKLIIISNLIFHRYHDVDGVSDFIILNSLYEESLAHNWNPGQRFRSLIDNKYWLGRVKEQKPFR